MAGITRYLESLKLQLIEITFFSNIIQLSGHEVLFWQFITRI